MHDTSRILVVVDPLKDAQQATVVRGALLAKALNRGIELLIVHVDREYTNLRVKNPKGWKTARHKIVDRHADHLEGIAAILKGRGLDVLISVSCDWPLDESIVRHTLYTNPYMVIKETQYHYKLNRALFNYADWSLITNCPFPLWLARAENSVENSPVLACVDPSHPNDQHASLDKRILETTVALSNKIGVEAHVFHALLPDFDTSMPDTVTSVLSDGSVVYEHFENHKEPFERLVSNYKFKPANIHAVAGFPENKIPEMEKELGAGVVVLGAVARNWLGKVFIGNTAERLLDRLSADMLVLKPDGFRTPVDALSHADVKKDPRGHIFQVPAGTREEWAGNKAQAVT